MTQLPVQRSVPPPAPAKNAPKYPWPTMKPGDSFLVVDRIEAASARSSFARYVRLGRIPAWYYVTQRVEGAYIRLWMME